MQFHEEPGKERVNIVLGVFHEKVHREWAMTNTHKIVKKDNGKVYQISNLYTQGDLCTETGTHRYQIGFYKCKFHTYLHLLGFAEVARFVFDVANVHRLLSKSSFICSSRKREFLLHT